MKYKIEVFGRGLDSFIFSINEDQYENLYDSDVEEDSLTLDEICEIIGVEDYSESKETLLGILVGSTHGEFMNIVVTDDEGNTVWESTDNFDFSEVDEHYDYNDGHFISISDYQKGLFFIGELELEEEFNPELLSAKITEALEGKIELITDINYNGSNLNLDFGDTSSKGFNFSLI